MTETERNVSTEEISLTSVETTGTIETLQKPIFSERDNDNTDYHFPNADTRFLVFPPVSYGC
jgi:hypothetical protein